MDKETELEQVKQEGFDAISNAMKKLYPTQEGIHYGTIIPYFLGGNDPLTGVEVWQSEQGIPHWHYVTYGFTELYEKESDYLEESGYGFELTFRLKRGDETEPPSWPISLLQNLARYVFSTGNVFGAGHHMSCNGPIALETDTKLTALGFRVDPELGEMDTPNGHMAFLQAVGITEDEMDALMCWDTRKFLAELERHIPFCVVDLERDSQMENEEFYSAWQKGMEQDGSSTGFFYMDEVGAQLVNGQGQLRLGAGHIHTLVNMLGARVGKGRDLSLQSREEAVFFSPGSHSKLAYEDELLHITLTEENLTEFCEVLQPHAGIYPLKTIPLTIELIPTKITDRDGNVLRVIE